VAEIEPFTSLGQALGARTPDQLLEIWLRGGRACRRATAGGGQYDQGEAGQCLARTTPSRRQAKT
jgi:hypothetical protein